MNQIKSKNIHWHHGEIGRQDRERQGNHKGVCLWFTGLSGSGKSTIAQETARMLFNRGIRTYVLDGDNIRHGLNQDLGFSPDDRNENIRRIGEVARLFVDAGLVVLTAFISPYRADRGKVRELMPAGDFLEVFVKADLETCEARDPKGLYKKAHAGEIKEFTGISAPYEEPLDPEILINTTEEADVQTNARSIVKFLDDNHYLDINHDNSK